VQPSGPRVVVDESKDLVSRESEVGCERRHLGCEVGPDGELAGCTDAAMSCYFTRQDETTMLQIQIYARGNARPRTRVSFRTRTPLSSLRLQPHFLTIPIDDAPVGKTPNRLPSGLFITHPLDLIQHSLRFTRIWM
jgi:hypothetical protein